MNEVLEFILKKRSVKFHICLGILTCFIWNIIWLIAYTYKKVLENNRAISTKETSSVKSESIPSPKLIYDKLIPISNTNTEGRQRLIKKLLKEDDIPINSDLSLESLSCECDIKKPDFESKNKILEVIVILDSLPYTVGYITQEYKEFLSPELHNNTHYSTTLYVSKEDGLYSLELSIQFYEN